MKKAFKRKKHASEIPSRITNETVAEHRERILAGGRKFKYPVQYVRHRLVLNTVIISVAALVLFSVFTWFQLYQAQSSGVFAYRVARVLPLPVASIDGEMVRYSDYLMYYRSQEYYLTQYERLKPNTPDGKVQIDWVKRETLNNVERDAYAAKLAREANINVTNEEVEKVRENDRVMQNGKISQEARDASTRTVLNWSPDEYRSEIKRRLLVQKVAFHIDEKANAKRDKAAELVKTKDANFAEIATKLSDDTSKVEHGASGLIGISSALSSPIADAAKMKQGEVSGAIRGAAGDGYYFVRIVEKTDSRVNYEFIRIPLTQLDDAVQQLRKDGKITEYIKLDDVKPPESKQ